MVAQYADTVDSSYQSSSVTKTQVVNLGTTATTVTPQVTGGHREPLAFTAAVALRAPLPAAPPAPSRSPASPVTPATS